MIVNQKKRDFIKPDPSDDHFRWAYEYLWYSGGFFWYQDLFHSRGACYYTNWGLTNLDKSELRTYLWEKWGIDILRASTIRKMPNGNFLHNMYFTSDNSSLSWGWYKRLGIEYGNNLRKEYYAGGIPKSK